MLTLVTLLVPAAKRWGRVHRLQHVQQVVHDGTIGNFRAERQFSEIDDGNRSSHLSSCRKIIFILIDFLTHQRSVGPAKSSH